MSQFKLLKHYILMSDKMRIKFVIGVQQRRRLACASTCTTYVQKQFYIMLTCERDLNPLSPNFYIVELGFTGIYIIFLFLLKT